MKNFSMSEKMSGDKQPCNIFTRDKGLMFSFGGWEGWDQVRSRGGGGGLRYISYSRDITWVCTAVKSIVFKLFSLG